MIPGRCFWLVLIGFLVAPLALAHDARPIAIELTQETGSNAYLVRMKVPNAIPDSRVPLLSLGAGCDMQGTVHTDAVPGSAILSYAYVCNSRIEGRSVNLEFPASNPSLSTIIRLSLDDGSRHSVILAPGDTQWQVPEQEQALQVALQYGWLGVKHIWLGIDHLLFVLCLLFIAGHGRQGRWRRILVTITGFTIAHSVTLVMSALGFVSLPVPAVEAVIALSIVFLALEIWREDPDSLTYRYPVAVAVSFGLLHGFGFASVLREIGLPQTELPVALLMFNLGVELGQVLFILLALMVTVLAGARVTAMDTQVRLGSSYLVGAVASYWLIDRTLTFWLPV